MPAASCATRVARRLDSVAVGVEQIGSSAVSQMLAKPIVDLAVGVLDVEEISAVSERLEDDGWLYRGDAGDSGGHVFVLEARRSHRVAHLHVVEHDGPQWINYLRLRDLLRTDAAARQRYERTKLDLASRHRNDREAYTNGKDDVVRALLDDVS